MNNETELSIVVKARNAASKVLKEVNQQGSAIGRNFKNAFNSAVAPSKMLAAGVAAIGVAAAGFGVMSVKAFMEAEESLAQLEAVIKSTGGAAGVTSDELQKQATALQSVTKFSDEAVMATQSMLLTFTQIKGGVMKDATETALDMAQALGMDGKQAAMQLGKALNDPATGLSKLQRVGVTFNEQQKKQITAMVEAGNVAGAQKAMLKELQKEFGGSAKAAGSTFAGQLEILKNAFGDLQEGVGMLIVSALKPLVNALSGIVAEIGKAGGFVNYFKKLWEDNQGIIVAITGALVGGLTPALISFSGAMLAAAVRTALFFAPLLPWIAIGAALGILLKKLADRMGGWGKLWDAVKGKIESFMPTLKNIASAFQNGLGKAIEFVKPILETIGKVIMTVLWPALKSLWSTVSAQLQPVINSLIETFKAWWGYIQALWPILKIIGIIIGITLVAAIWLFINALKLVLPVVNVIVKAIGVAFDVMAFIIRGIVSVFRVSFNIAKAVVLGTINGVKALFVGAFNFLKTIVNGYIAFWRGAFNIAVSIVRGIINAILAVFRGGFAAGKALLTGLINGIKSLVNGVRNAIKTAADKIGAFFKGAGTWLVDTGKNIIQGLINGIKGMAGSVWSAAGDVASGIKDRFKSVLGIQSPSKVMKEIGKNVGQGFIKGLDGTKKQIRNKVEDLIQKTINSVKKKLNSLKKVRADFIKEIQGSIMGNFNITDVVGNRALTGGNIIDAMRDQLEKSNMFAADLKELSKRGLSRTLLKQIADSGVEAGSATAQALLSADAKTVNSLFSQLNNSAKAIGTSVAGNYQKSGIDAMEGLLKGLRSKKGKLTKLITEIAMGMKKGLKKALGIRSPSKVFKGLGENIMQGMEKGISSQASIVGNAITSAVSPNILQPRLATALGDVSSAPAKGSIKHEHKYYGDFHFHTGESVEAFYKHQDQDKLNVKKGLTAKRGKK